MRASFAIVAAAAIASNASANTDAEDAAALALLAEAAAYLLSCGVWQATVFAFKEGDGWTVTEGVDSITYKDANGTVVDDWSSFEGYADSGCAEVDAAVLAEAAAQAAAAEEADADGAAYLSFGAAIAATGAALAF